MQSLKPVRLLPPLVGAIGLFAACSDGNPTGEPGVTIAERILAAEEAVFHELCECHAALDFESDGACYRSFVARTEPEKGCILQLFEENSAAIERTVECQLRVVANARTCLEAVEACDREDTVACLFQGLAARDACGPYPDVVEHGLDVCYGLVEP